MRAGETIPIDGKIRIGHASVDQRALSGESQPSEKAPGDSVFAATFVLAGKIQVEVLKTGSDTLSVGVTKALNKAVSFKEQLDWRHITGIHDR